MSSIHPHHVAGYVSQTDRATYVADLFEAVGVPRDEMRVNDAQVDHRAHRTCVAVSEGVDGDMDPDEFSAFMQLAHALVRDASADEETRFGPSVETIFVGYEHVDRLMDTPTTPAEAGEQLADPNEIMSDNDDASSYEELSEDHITWNGARQFTVWDPTVDAGIEPGGKAFIVDLAEATCSCDLGDPQTCPHIRHAVKHGNPSPSVEERITTAHIQLVQDAVSLTREAQQNVAALASGGSAGGSAGGSGGGGGDDGDLIQDVPGDYDDYDLSALESEIEDWLEGYEQVKSDFDAGIVEIETGRVEGSVGFVFDTNPFQAGYHDGDDWNDQDGFNAAWDAWKSITQGEDPIQYHGEPDYINFLPAAKVEDVV